MPRKRVKLVVLLVAVLLMCGTDSKNKPYDCQDCNCSTSSLYTPKGHDVTFTKIEGIYYYHCAKCGKDC